MVSQNFPFAPLVELTRGPLVESIHYGALTVVDATGKIIIGLGDPDFVANLRSSAKPFQSLPIIEQDGAAFFHLSQREIALTCASHSGTDEHVSVLKSIHAKIGITESNLQCGIHAPGHDATARAMFLRGEEPTPYRHNCSGKHTGMLAQAILAHQPTETYLSVDSEIQKRILRTFAEVLGMSPEDILIGIDGCSAPTFAAPLRKAALGFARLADPSSLPDKRAAALRNIASSMMANPDMVGGPGTFDTMLMQAGNGKIVCKGGAEGYQGIGLLPGALGPGSPALGITYKVIDGDQAGRARPVIGTSLLRQLGALNEEQLAQLKNFTPRPIYNSRHLEVGVIRPASEFTEVVLSE
ncbi:MAG: asparaginase [Anaerolineaceae bacterium]|nr:asparaginase [Anaerolineaceae bacterium]